MGAEEGGLEGVERPSASEAIGMPLVLVETSGHRSAARSAEGLLDPVEELALGLEPLDDGLDDPARSARGVGELVEPPVAIRSASEAR